MKTGLVIRTELRQMKKTQQCKERQKEKAKKGDHKDKKKRNTSGCTIAVAPPLGQARQTIQRKELE